MTYIRKKLREWRNRRLEAWLERDLEKEREEDKRWVRYYQKAVIDKEVERYHAIMDLREAQREVSQLWKENRELRKKLLELKEPQN